ncbi:MAG TPA: YbaB/EbfC family nucleoid-associated protein [Alphaproteobacteria bacterium]|nr:YbaB/EbfC family nucleoid-associated protein [Alphaproteobacteria bacterium]
MFKNFGGIMKQAQQLQDNVKKVQEKIAAMEMQGASGGGVVQVTISGTHDMKKIKIEPSLCDPKEVEVLEDLILAAYQDAKNKLEAITASEMKQISGGLNIPGLKLPF